MADAVGPGWRRRGGGGGWGYPDAAGLEPGPGSPPLPPVQPRSRAVVFVVCVRQSGCVRRELSALHTCVYIGCVRGCRG